MNDLHDYCMQQITMLDDLIAKAEEMLKKAPEGSLRVSTSNHTMQYYYKKNSGDYHGIYIKKSQQHFAALLAQKEYTSNFLSIAYKQKELLQSIMLTHFPKELIHSYENLPPAKQKLVTPYLLPDEDYIVHWLEDKQKIKHKHGDDLALIEEEDAILTEKGERVRSKSEKILADKLYKLEIPYVYESPLFLDGVGYIKPDFTTLNVRTRTEFYWEHLGLIDDYEYCEKAIRKIEAYERNGIYSGCNLILTYETKRHPFNVRAAERLAIKFLK